MGWNIEVACVRVTDPASVESVVPDVFTRTGKVVGFEDATSVVRGTDLCAGVAGEWAVLIDVECRLSGAGPWLDEVSVGRDLFVVRVADQPVAVQYRDGVAVAEYRGANACTKAHGRTRTGTRGHVDGEQVACDLLRAWTGVGFPEDFWKVRFAVYAVN